MSYAGPVPQGYDQTAYRNYGLMVPGSSSTDLGNSGYYIPPINNQPAVYQPPTSQTQVSPTPNQSTNQQTQPFQSPTDLARQAQQDQYNREVQASYDQSQNYLNQAGGVAQSALEAAQAQAASQYQVNASQLGDSRQNAFDSLAKQQQTGTQGYENALASARSAFQEQQQGANQRFGGSSSAGQAASEIQAREQARQFGQTNRQYSDLVNNIATQHAAVDRDYQTQLLGLQQGKQAALNSAQQDFNNKLLSISQNRTQLSQAKADASLQALATLRNQVFAIESQYTQFQQNFALMDRQAQLGLGRYSTQAAGYLDQVTQPQYQQSSATSATSGLNQGSSDPYASFAGPIGRDPRYIYDQNGQPIANRAY